MNPLHHIGKPFEVEFQNPNPTSSKTQHGPIYRLSLEVPRELWDYFMEAETVGMVLGGALAVTALNPPEKPKREVAEQGLIKARHGKGMVHASELGAGSSPAPTTEGAEIARELHARGAFRNPLLWMALDRLGIYTQYEHEAAVLAQECASVIRRGEFFDSRRCGGDLVLHHCKSPGTIGKDPDHPQKPPKFYGLALCHAHHRLWAHGTATREEKQWMLERAIAFSAEQVKAAVKRHLHVEHSNQITSPMLSAFEEEVGVKLL